MKIKKTGKKLVTELKSQGYFGIRIGIWIMFHTSDFNKIYDSNVFARAQGER